MTEMIASGDAEFLRAFEACEITNEGFRHRDHIRLAYIYVQQHGEREAQRRIAAGIRKFAAFHGKDAKYHETITIAWARLVSDAMTRLPACASFEELARAAPELLDKQLIERFYSRAILDSDSARTGWMEPDRRPLP